MAQKHGFWTFKKFYVISFVWNLYNILQKLHVWEESGSQVTAKNGFLPMRFQYSLTVNISLID